MNTSPCTHCLTLWMFHCTHWLNWKRLVSKCNNSCLLTYLFEGSTFGESIFTMRHLLNGQRGKVQWDNHTRPVSTVRHLLNGQYSSTVRHSLTDLWNHTQRNSTSDVSDFSLWSLTCHFAVFHQTWACPALPLPVWAASTPFPGIGQVDHRRSVYSLLQSWRFLMRMNVILQLDREKC